MEAPENMGMTDKQFNGFVRFYKNLRGLNSKSRACHRLFA